MTVGVLNTSMILFSGILINKILSSVWDFKGFLKLVKYKFLEFISVYEVE